MIDPKNQVIYFKKKRVEFDALPSEVQESLLKSWKVKNYKHPKTEQNGSKQTEQTIRKETGASESPTKTKGAKKAASKPE